MLVLSFVEMLFQSNVYEDAFITPENKRYCTGDLSAWSNSLLYPFFYALAMNKNPAQFGYIQSWKTPGPTHQR